MSNESTATVGLKEVIITEESILKKGEPILVYKPEHEQAKAEVGAKN